MHVYKDEILMANKAIKYYIIVLNADKIIRFLSQGKYKKENADLGFLLTDLEQVVGYDSIEELKNTSQYKRLSNQYPLNRVELQVYVVVKCVQVKLHKGLLAIVVEVCPFLTNINKEHFECLRDLLLFIHSDKFTKRLVEEGITKIPTINSDTCIELVGTASTIYIPFTLQYIKIIINGAGVNATQLLPKSVETTKILNKKVRHALVVTESPTTTLIRTDPASLVNLVQDSDFFIFVLLF